MKLHKHLRHVLLHIIIVKLCCTMWAQCVFHLHSQRWCCCCWCYLRLCLCSRHCGNGTLHTKNPFLFCFSVPNQSGTFHIWLVMCVSISDVCVWLRNDLAEHTSSGPAQKPCHAQIVWNFVCCWIRNYMNVCLSVCVYLYFISKFMWAAKANLMENYGMALACANIVDDDMPSLILQ